MKLADVRLDSINTSDERFRISYYFDLTPFTHSIAKIGLIHPPVITYREGDALIVTGWKRILACQSLGLSSIPCLVFEGEDDLETFRLGLEDNLSFRPFTLLEKAHTLHRLVQWGVPLTTIVKEHLPLLKIPQTLNHLEVYLRIAALDPETKKVVHTKNIGYPIAQLLTEYGEEDRRLFLPFLLLLGQNKQKELLQNLLEISRRDQIPVHNILTSGDVQRTAANQNLSTVQKAEKIRDLIRRRRYPTLSSWEDSFKARKKDLDWPDGIKIEPSPFFEGEEFTAQFTFKDLEEYKTKLAKLNELASDTKISRLLKPPPKNKNE